MCQSIAELVNHAPAASTPPEPLPCLSPLRFWKIEESFRCPVIGICLTPAEQKHLLRNPSPAPSEVNTFTTDHMSISSCQSVYAVMNVN